MRNKTKRLEIRLSEEEFNDIEKKSRKAGLSYSELVRRLIKECRIVELPPVDYFTLICEVRRVGSNINQLLKIANCTGILNAEEIKAAIDNVYETEEMLWENISFDKTK